MPCIARTRASVFRVEDTQSQSLGHCLSQGWSGSSGTEQSFWHSYVSWAVWGLLWTISGEVTESQVTDTELWFLKIFIARVGVVKSLSLSLFFSQASAILLSKCMDHPKILLEKKILHLSMCLRKENRDWGWGICQKESCPPRCSPNSNLCGAGKVTWSSGQDK